MIYSSSILDIYLYGMFGIMIMHIIVIDQLLSFNTLLEYSLIVEDMVL